MTDVEPLNRQSAEVDLHQEQLRSAKLLIQQGKFSKASKQLKQLLDESPLHRDALYYLAVCQRKRQLNSEAQHTLERLISEHPQYGRAYQEMGHNFLAQKNTRGAMQSFEKAVALNPALIASWKALIPHYKADSQTDQLQAAMAHVQWLSQLPPQLQSVTSLIHENRLQIAEQLCRQFLKQHAHHPEAMRLLAEIGSKLQILDDAEFLLESCVEFYPDNTRARMDYVQVLHKRQKFEKALEQAKKLHAMAPDNIAFEVALASENQATGNFDEALTIYQRVIDRKPDSHTVHSALGHALKTIGRTDEAIESYRNAYQIKADFGDAYWSLANLKTYNFTDGELTIMRTQEQLESTSAVDRVHLCFALGKALEDRQQYGESFEFYHRGNALKQQAGQYRAERLEKEFDAQKKLFDTDFFNNHKGSGCDSTAPIFIVGLPRAGSTLLEQILASHSQVDGTMELANIIGLAHRLGGRRTNQQGARYPAILGELTEEQLLKFGEDFIADTQIHRQQGAYFIDKMPNNFRHIALIQLILPNAKIIDARREPMACCFSGFKQLFAEGQEFTYGLESIGRYYRAYVELMNHWDEMLPGRVLRVQHEDVIEDLETEVGRILDHCELPFEQSCIDFHKTERAVRTPSSEQVRQPIFKSAMQQWKHYEAHLQPLRDALGPALNNYR